MSTSEIRKILLKLTSSKNHRLIQEAQDIPEIPNDIEPMKSFAVALSQSQTPTTNRRSLSFSGCKGLKENSLDLNQGVVHNVVVLIMNISTSLEIFGTNTPKNDLISQIQIIFTWIFFLYFSDLRDGWIALSKISDLKNSITSIREVNIMSLISDKIYQLHEAHRVYQQTFTEIVQCS